MRESPRTRRLKNDLKAMERLRSDSSILDYTAPSMQADAPDSYIVRFVGKGLWREESGEILLRERHEVLVKLGASYPRTTPELAWRTPIFHPNISAGGAVCLGGYGTHWTPSLMLDELCTMLWDMIRYENFDVESPYNREAATWTKMQNRYVLPVDRRSIRDKVAGEAPLPYAPPITHRPVPLAPRSEPEVVFLEHRDAVEAEIVEAELVEEGPADSFGAGEDSDILFIE